MSEEAKSLAIDIFDAFISDSPSPEEEADMTRIIDAALRRERNRVREECAVMCDDEAAECEALPLKDTTMRDGARACARGIRATKEDE